MTDNRDELMACPFCGGSDHFVEREDFSSAYVMCNNCSARGPAECQSNDDEETPGEENARKAWNARHLASQPSSYEAGREALDKHRAKLASLRKSQRQKMNRASDAAERSAAEGDMTGVSINSTESERHREAFSALNAAIDIFDALDDALEKALALSAPVEAPVAVKPLAYRYRWKIDGEWTSWHVSDHTQKVEGHLPSLEEVPLYATPRPLPSRDELARLVDPDAFKMWQDLFDYSKRDGDEAFAKRCADHFHKTACDEALAKATAILTLLGGSAR